jgi:hypothetical protein
MMNFTRGNIHVTEWLILLFLVSGVVAFGVTIPPAPPLPEELPPTAPETIRNEIPVIGEVVMIEGNVQFVEDPSGRMTDVYLVMERLYVVDMSGAKAIHFFHVNETTLMDDDLRVGDEVEVLASDHDEALSIKKME